MASFLFIYFFFFYLFVGLVWLSKCNYYYFFIKVKYFTLFVVVAHPFTTVKMDPLLAFCLLILHPQKLD